MKEESLKLKCEMFVLALLINEETDYCVFVSYSGHVDSIDFTLAESKQMYNSKIFETERRTNFRKRYEENKEDELAYLKAQRDVLKQILENNELPYEELERHIEEVVTYTI